MASKNTDSSQLTDRQQFVLDAIWDYWRECGMGPSIRDLCDATEIASPNGITAHLEPMVKKGAIEWIGGNDAGNKSISRAIWPAGLRQKIMDLAYSEAV